MLHLQRRSMLALPPRCCAVAPPRHVRRLQVGAALRVVVLVVVAGLLIESSGPPWAVQMMSGSLSMAPVSALCRSVTE